MTQAANRNTISVDDDQTMMMLPARAAAGYILTVFVARSQDHALLWPDGASVDRAIFLRICIEPTN